MQYFKEEPRVEDNQVKWYLGNVFRRLMVKSIGKTYFQII